MTTTASMTGADKNNDASRPLDTPELIDRMAENLRNTTGIDLPHAYFVEQVKRQLAGSPAQDTGPSDTAPNAGSKSSALYQSSDCFKAWAMRD